MSTVPLRSVVAAAQFTKDGEQIVIVFRVLFFGCFLSPLTTFSGLECDAVETWKPSMDSDTYPIQERVETC